MKGIKALSIVLLATISLTSCSDKATGTKKKEKTGLERMGLKGKVQSLKTTTYYADGKEEPQDSSFIRRTELRTFNEEGFPLLSKEYNSNKVLTDSIIFQYDDNGHTIEIFIYDQEGRVKTNSILKKNKDGLATEDSYFLHKYSEDGTVTIDTAMMYQMEYKFNDKGQATEADVKIGSFPQQSAKQVFEYDDKGNKIKELVYHADTLNFEGLNKYYEDGTLQETAISDYKDGKKIPREIYKYNEQGQEVERLTYKADTLFSKQVMEYDKFGNRLSLTHYDADGKKTHKERTYAKYKYDDQDNWISRVSYNNGKPSEIEVREITYFK